MARPDRIRQLTVSQQNAIDVLCLGRPDREAAEAAGVSRQTVNAWRRFNPDFQAELNRRRADLWAGAVDRLRGLIPPALDVLERELEAGDDRVRAAATILKHAGLHDLGQYPVGPTDATEIVDQEIRQQRGNSTEELLQSLALGGPITEEDRTQMRAGFQSSERAEIDSGQAR